MNESHAAPRRRRAVGECASDESCGGTTHALLDPCAPHPVEIYIAFPAGQDLKTFEGKNVVLRGSIHQTDCERVVLKASSIGPSTEPFTCDEPGNGQRPRP